MCESSSPDNIAHDKPAPHANTEGLCLYTQYRAHAGRGGNPLESGFK